MDRYTIVIIARLKLVAQLELDTVLVPEVRVIQISNVACITSELMVKLKIVKPQMQSFMNVAQPASHGLVYYCYL